MMYVAILPSLVALLGVAKAIPPPTRVQERQLIGSVVTGLVGDAAAYAAIASDIIDAAKAVAPTNVPTSIPDALNRLEDIYTGSGTFLDNVVELAANGFIPGDLSDIAESYTIGINSANNANPSPRQDVYNRRQSGEPSFTLSESDLRKVIYIPDTFTYGRKPPVILFPGTGSRGGLSYGANYIKLLRDVDYADAVWVNTPQFSLNDAQITAEYAAYAIRYIAAISGRKPSVITWSQGSLNVQWAQKFFPSARSQTKQIINLSADYHGTQLAYVICPFFPEVECAESVIQQEYVSNFVNVLRQDNGDSAYVPTTSIYSATDEVVQPQAGADASAILKDARQRGITNVLLQEICNGRPAGTFYSHEGILYNPLAFALAKDALIHGGPANVSRVDLDTICYQAVSPGLSLEDVLATEGIISVAAVLVIAGTPRSFDEPAIQSYARSGRTINEAS